MTKINPALIRVIPRLDIKGANVVKGVHFEGLRVIGDPGELAAAYYEGGADEILYMDAVASLYGRNSLHDTIARAAERIFIALTVGGGVRSLDDARRLLLSGADKVVVNTALFQDVNLITAIADAFGSQCMVVSIDAAKINGQYECLVDGGRERTGVSVESWVEQVIAKGAGEILLTSVDREGTGRGFDCELVKLVSGEVSVPLVVCGGAGCSNDVTRLLLDNDGVNAVGIASMFHYFMAMHVQYKNGGSGGNSDFLRRVSEKKAQGRKGVDSLSILDLKRLMRDAGIPVRIKEFIA